MKSSRIVCKSIAVLVAVVSTAVLAESPPEYKVTRTVTLGAPDRWDYVTFDPASDRVYVSHGDEVTVVNGSSGEIIGQIRSFPGGTHGIALVAGAERGYTDDGRAGEAVSFNLKTLAVEKHIKAAEDADGIVFDSVSGHVFVINGDTGTVTVIDPTSDAAIATINAGGKLEFAAPGDNGKLYVNGAEAKEVVRIDTRSNKVDARWPIPECTSPHGAAIDTQSHRLFVSCVNNVLTVVNTDSGTVVAKLAIGSGTDAAAFDPRRKLVFSSNGRDGTLSVIQERDPQTFVSLGNINTALSARTMSINPATGRIYLAAADIDHAAADKPPAPGAPARRGLPIVPGSLKLIFLDPPR
jgi:YVTN family beta-propeller protein